MTFFEEELQRKRPDTVGHSVSKGHGGW